ncbi:DNA replication/repair protein RecF [Salinibius halmophilus]|uniref:DNA replication/repair protein RecF n=1 Tax=Salinibius halmophilus TaxID=1853216 RepID=UPI000E66C1EA|nr:DNA replication/repair protein RecF [Salinibius halmophilus]
MTQISQLSLQNFRNIAQLSISPQPGINVIYGENGAGKTSLLEAIHFLSLARGFTRSRSKHLTRLGEEQSVVFAKLNGGDKLGIERSKDNNRIRLNGDTVRSAAELAELLPVQVFSSDAFQLLEGSPQNRRAFMDWGVFHVEHGFLANWQTFRTTLKHRNQMLRSGNINTDVLSAFDEPLVRSAIAVDEARQRWLTGFMPVFTESLAQLTEISDISISYRRGWDKTKPYPQALADMRQRDIERGTTQSGPQRADLVVRYKGVPAADALSRGQQKLLVAAMKLAQAKLFMQQTKQKCVFLIDDLPSELDVRHQAKVAQLLENLASQVFVTAIDKLDQSNLWSNSEAITWFQLADGQLVASGE